jgi:hypothetical protein
MIICGIDIAKTDAEQCAFVIARIKDGVMEIIDTDSFPAPNTPERREAYEAMVDKIVQRFPNITKLYT